MQGNDDPPPILSLIDLSPRVYLGPVCVLGNGAAGPLNAGGYLTAPRVFHSLLPHTCTHVHTKGVKGPK